MNTYKFIFGIGLLISLGMLSPLELAAQWESSIVSVDSVGRLYYQRDIEGNMIPNFSHAGYEGGGVALPQLGVNMTIGPILGDNTAHLQAAIDALSAMPVDSNGFRGALLLDTGRYEIHGTLYVDTDGVVLRGKGDGADPASSTILVGIGNVPNQRDILIVGGGGSTNWSGRVSGTPSFALSDKVLVGDYRIKVERPGNFMVGDNIIINHPCTNEWLTAIDGGGSVSEPAWTENSQPLIFNRRIVAIEDSVLVLDVPLFNTLDRSLSPFFVYTYDRNGLVSHVGVENLRIDIETAGGTDENHAWNALAFRQVEDAWVKGCTFLHFGLAGVYTTTATRVTIEDCRALDPVAMVTGARMYNFNLLAASSQILVRDCYASNGRHHYVSNGTSSVSGCVFLDCISEAAYNASEGHRRWSMGLLYENLREVNIRQNNVLLGLYNRGDYGTAHGWSAAHSVAWNCDMGTAQLVVQKPPTAQNYAIACKGLVRGDGPWPGPSGFIEGTNQLNLKLTSLYQAQLDARLNDLEPVITLAGGTNVENDFQNLSWKIYPNPSSGQLKVKNALNQPFTARIFDVNGRLVKKLDGSFQNQFDLSELRKGNYLIQLDQGHHVYHQRWIKE